MSSNQAGSWVTDPAQPRSSQLRARSIPSAVLGRLGRSASKATLAFDAQVPDP